ncbi:MAG: hypothetical protein ABSG41_15925 [Bryobacteraceae bacterium]
MANQQMRVVRHHHPRGKTIEMPLAISDQNGVGDQVSNPRVAKPPGSRGAPIQNTILSHESMAASGVDSGIRPGQ